MGRSDWTWIAWSLIDLLSSGLWAELELGGETPRVRRKGMLWSRLPRG